MFGIIFLGAQTRIPALKVPEYGTAFIVSSETKLFNLSTVQIVSDHSSEGILCFYDDGKENT